MAWVRWNDRGRCEEKNNQRVPSGQNKNSEAIIGTKLGKQEVGSSENYRWLVGKGCATPC